MTVYVGTSGWQYKHWREAFYPRTLAQREWLPYFADRFQVVEVNNTFYSLPRAEVFAAWRERTPPDFRFALKMSRYLTHLKRLRDPEEPVERFVKAAGELKEKIGPVLLQMPPNMSLEVSRLRSALRAFPERLRIAVEFRNDSWYSEEMRRALTERDAALCLVDRREEVITPEWRTADWGYVRLHEGAGEPRPCYSDRCLREWAQRLVRLWDEGADVYVFFNNDALGCALGDARRLAKELDRAGRTASRVPAEDEVVARR